jgi:adenine-specific DNA-methyltransferase
LAKDLQREADALADRRAFGLNFERHVPEAVDLPGRPVRKNDKVRILPDRGEMPKKVSRRIYRVTRTFAEGGEPWADVVAVDATDEEWCVRLDDLVVVAEFRDPIYPGLVSTGKVERGGDKPFHTVINAENYHALQALLLTHRGKIDVIYIDPPYNTRDKDWKYNNDYVDRDDLYRHSKWLAMMERRLCLARELLRPDDGVIIVTIDENEGNRLALLLEQIFEGYAISPVHIVHNPRGIQGDNFSFVHETAYYAIPKNRALVAGRVLTEDEVSQGTSNLRNWGTESNRLDAANCFYPILVKQGKVVGFGADVTGDDSIHPAHNEEASDGVVAVWPVDGKGIERKWRYARQSVEGVKHLLLVKHLERGELKGDLEVLIAKEEGKQRTVWQGPKFDASTHGTQIVKSLLGRPFPYPKSLYAVEECLDIIVRNRPAAVVLDFFAGSGTTGHAVLRLNHADGGQRQAILVTNNEVAADEERVLRKAGLRPGDAAWEALGICEHVTNPRMSAAVTGRTPEGDPVVGNYNFSDEFPMAEGFLENVEFFALTYESAMRVSSNRDFVKIAPFLWLRAGSRGRRIDDISAGWDVADTYGVIADLDLSEPFIQAVEEQDGLTHAFIVTDEDRLFEAMVRQLPGRVEPVRLYSTYLRNFEIEAGRGAR